MGSEIGGLMEYAAIAPVFDRLIDEDIDTPLDIRPKQFLSLEELQMSIIRDLSNLLNTRATLSWHMCIEKIATPYAYGVKMKIPTSPENVFEIQELEANIDKAIRDFEPRLIDAHSHVIGIGDPAGTLEISIDAIIAYKNHHSPLSFPIVISI